MFLEKKARSIRAFRIDEEEIPEANEEVTPNNMVFFSDFRLYYGDGKHLVRIPCFYNDAFELEELRDLEFIVGGVIIKYAGDTIHVYSDRLVIHTADGDLTLNFEKEEEKPRLFKHYRRMKEIYESLADKKPDDKLTVSVAYLKDILTTVIKDEPQEITFGFLKGKKIIQIYNWEGRIVGLLSPINKSGEYFYEAPDSLPPLPIGKQTSSEEMGKAVNSLIDEDDDIENYDEELDEPWLCPICGKEYEGAEEANECCLQ